MPIPSNSGQGGVLAISGQPGQTQQYGLPASGLLGWTTIMTTELGGLATGNMAIGNTAVANNTALDILCDISFVSGAAVTGTGQPYVGIYLYPLNADGSTYGDGQTSGAVVPGSNYWVGNISGVAAGQKQTGTLWGVRMPPGVWKPVVYNALGNSLTANSTAPNILAFRPYNYFAG
jgi:hypothetical protein